jgi:hypothetical protein
MKCFKLFLVALASSVFLVSCSKEELPSFPSAGNYENGFFVLNEGNASTGTVSFVKSNFSSVYNNVFGTENSSEYSIGGYVQSMFFSGDKSFIISGSSNKITIVNRNTFKYIGTVNSGLNNPRYGVVYNGKAYVTNLGDFANLTDDFISVINVANYSIETTIPVNAIADKILLINSKLYITNGTYGEGNTVTIINPSTNSIEKTLTFGNSPNSFEESDGKLYVLCSNYTTASELVKIDLTTETIESAITLPATLENAQNLNIDGDQLYFTVGNKIYKNSIANTSIAVDSFLTLSTEPTSLYGFEAKSNVLYVGNANGSSDGKALIYSNTGSLLYQIEVGLFPNGFYFN